MTFEFAILNFIQHYMRSDVMDQIMIAITHLGDAGMIWIILTALLLFIPTTRKVGIVLMAALIFDLVLCNFIVKPFIARTRPYDINTAIQLLIGRQEDYSFPSGHTAAGIACVVGLYLTRHLIRQRWLWKMALALSVLIAFSRMYLYVHFPTDIIGGVIVGGVCGILGYYTVKAFSKRQM